MNLTVVKTKIVPSRYDKRREDTEYGEIRVPKESIHEVHEVISRLWPNHSVVFEWYEGLNKCTLHGVPVYQLRDQYLLAVCEISEEEYYTRWPENVSRN